MHVLKCRINCTRTRTLLVSLEGNKRLAEGQNACFVSSDRTSKASHVPAHMTGSHRTQSGLIRRDREIRIFGYFSFFMHARIISERDFETIHLKIIIPEMAFFGNNDLILLQLYELFSGDLGPVRY